MTTFLMRKQIWRMNLKQLLMNFVKEEALFFKLKGSETIGTKVKIRL